MRTARLALALVLAAGCGDSGSATNDAPPGGDGGGNDSGVDAPPAECTPDPLPACAAPVNGTTITLNQIGTTPLFTGDAAALLVTSPPNDPRLFVVGRGGQIKIVKGEDVNATPFFDISDADPEFAGNNERGLLGLAFHPLYACKGEFYVYYTTGNANIISRCTVSTADPDRANPTCTKVLSIPDFASNHNGGMIEFGADGYLYIGTGDGGGGGDPRRNGQALTNAGTTVALLGKMLRIDIDVKDPGKEYSIPASNPFAGGGGAPEIWMYGLRNPWRWSFDRETGDIWIGDVGQIKTEELTAIKAGEQSGKNLGWSIWEGDGCCADQGNGEPGDDGSTNGCEQNGTQQVCDMNAPSLVFPQDVRRHPTWISVIAGQTYRGSCYPDLVGWHLFTDHNSNAAGLHRARFMTGSNQLEVFNYPTNAPSLPSGVTSIHADARGELYLTRLNGAVYHVEAGP